MRVYKNLHIKLVEAKDIRPLRHKMLRQGKNFQLPPTIEIMRKTPFI